MLDPFFKQQMTNSTSNNDPFLKGNEMIVEPNIRDSQQVSLETIDQVVNSLQKQSDAKSSGSIAGLKCSLGLFCDNNSITISQEMSAHDICYIQQAELDRARAYLHYDAEKASQTITRYAKQFGQPEAVESLEQTAQPVSQKECELYSQNEVNAS